MLAVIEPTHNDFLALATYLIHGRERPTSPDRVAWVTEQNLGTDDPLRAARFMAATAERSRRCTNACYHVSINWHEAEQPAPEVMQEVALKTLTLAGLGEHQALFMGHGDKPHRHLHMMINRVHPETGRAWSTSHDYRRFDRIMRQLSEDFGFQYVPGHAFEPELTDDRPKQPNSAATHAARRGAPTSRPQWSRHEARTYAARISEHLDAGSAWDDLEQLFTEDGLVLAPKGKGWVVGNAQSYVKLSALGLQKTAKGFQKRRPPARRAPPSRPVMDAVEIVRGLALFGLADRTDIRNAVQEAQSARLAWLARNPSSSSCSPTCGRHLPPGRAHARTTTPEAQA